MVRKKRGISVTLTLIIINLIFFMLLIIGSYYNSQLVHYFAINPARVLQGAGLWTIVTSIFSHTELWHLAFNMMSLLFIGSLLERIIGKKRFLGIYLISGIFANIFFVIAALLFSQSLDMPALGASGAIFGIAGTLMMITPRLPVYVMLIPLPMPLWLGESFMLLFLWIISAIASIPIGNTAHLGGLIAGFLYGFYLRKKYGNKIRLVNRFLGLK